VAVLSLKKHENTQWKSRKLTIGTNGKKLFLKWNEGGSNLLDEIALQLSKNIRQGTTTKIRPKTDKEEVIH